tara:strand:+ start:1649 stop:2215 length:567 start_codon:yes stop_codon:yes gene_type:complete
MAAKPPTKTKKAPVSKRKTSKKPSTRAAKGKTSRKGPHKETKEEAKEETTLNALLSNLDFLLDQEALLEFVVDLLETNKATPIPSASSTGIVGASSYENFLFEMKQLASKAKTFRESAQNVRVFVPDNGPGGGTGLIKSSREQESDPGDGGKGTAVAKPKTSRSRSKTSSRSRKTNVVVLSQREGSSG